MVERGTGGVINVGSTAGFQPVPNMAVYGATKAFVLSFSEALHEEVRGSGVRIVALCPGVTATEFAAVAGTGSMVGPSRTVAEVVHTGLYAFERDRAVVTDGPANVLLAAMTRLAPRALVRRVGGWMTSRGMA
jgi:short-subunit dehydrogenase